MARKTKDIFHFKQFTVRHDRCAHKVGTDGVLLGAWADVRNAKRILDIGTGSGIIALMMAQRSSPDARIDAIEISSVEFEQASENIATSPWSKKIHIIKTALQEFESDSYDLIISNPPFFIDSAKPPKEERNRARHTESLPPEALLYHSKRLITAIGKLCLILPASEAQNFISLATGLQWHCTRLCEFRARAAKPIERILFQLERNHYSTKKESLVLYEKDEVWSSDYINLTRNFYLKI